MEFKNPKQEIKRYRIRLLVALGLVLLTFMLLFARFFWLQVMQHEYYRTRAENNRISLIPIQPNRGLIVDRNGVIMARNYSAYTLEIMPSRVGNLEETIDRLTEVIEVRPKDRAHFKKLLRESKNFESLPIRTRLSDEEVARFIARRFQFPGVDIKARLFRQYPNNESGAHLVGYIGRISTPDIERIENQTQEDNYRGTEHIGKTGLERHYEFDLHGQTGFEQVEVDAGGHAVRVLSRTPPVVGNNLTLTVDAKLQAMAEKAFGNRRGALVAIEPATGGILALVSVPSYDPNLFVDGITSADWQELNESPDRPLVNRALNGAYPPGSTFKPFMALAALSLGKRTAYQTFADPGFFNFGGRTFMDDKKGGHGSVDMYASIVQSCNTYYYMLANDLGIDGIAGFMAPFGFGSPTGIDIEGESRGVLPSPAWKKQRFKKPEQQRWYAGETISVGIGQGYNAYTPIQLAQATATLANDGVMFRPHLVRHITDSRSGEITRIEPHPLRTIPLRREHLDTIKHAMVGVNREGTAARAFAGAEYVSAGKTGTAQVYSLRGEKYVAGKVQERLRDHALFIAFAPVDQPKIALAVLVENAGFGAQSAAPIARMVMDYYLLGKEPQGMAADMAGEAEED
ncbi:transpeptidase involved in peptidoglycan synthesis (penicillin-binding protein 2) [Sterolibacterium denitrificans]|uniref:Peptidoglycan D,D-transpeptidase MrdA n=2 Tax=Sterolibacterium denitrificans TaxID=157592 RepID=A0A656Z7L0_9PROT|nr:penicillin-binding protein 2 [Sterolibacterium denitrificans]KYC28982.1 penicillin-binding protein [Sterolibacterium denitrificans]SMB22998.1 transpeptidase involved in peptidoglycan synthesis (penicillin-binding protein 2) [Sterolibacterium denitrificans]